MIEKLARKLVAWQVERNYLSAQEQNLYRYAFELLISQAVNLLIACLLAAVLQAYGTVLIFLISFIPLRSYAGGHHADTYAVCTVLSSLILGMVCVAEKCIPDRVVLFVNLGACVLSGVLIFALAPVADHNKPLDGEERRRYGKCSRAIWGLETAVWMVCYAVGAKRAGLVIALGYLALSGMLCAGVMKNKRLGG